MAADPADIARFITDGILIVSPVDPAVSAAIAAAHIDALDSGTGEIEQFFDEEADGQAMLDELFAIQSAVNPPYFAVEIEDSLGLGSAIPISPKVPCFRLTDEAQGLSVLLRTRGYAIDLGADRYSVELIQ